MERDGISFADALKLASDLERITREAKPGVKAEFIGVHGVQHDVEEFIVASIVY